MKISVWRNCAKRNSEAYETANKLSNPHPAPSQSAGLGLSLTYLRGLYFVYTLSSFTHPHYMYMNPHACGQAPWLPARQHHEDAHTKGTQVTAENLFKTFLDFPSLIVAGFPLRFLVSEVSHTSADYTSCTPWAHSPTHTTCMLWCLIDLQEERGTVTPQSALSTYCMSLRPSIVLAVPQWDSMYSV